MNPNADQPQIRYYTPPLPKRSPHTVVVVSADNIVLSAHLHPSNAGAIRQPTETIAVDTRAQFKIGDRVHVIPCPHRPYPRAERDDSVVP